MSRCPTCRLQFDKGEQFCPRDGSPLGADLSNADPYLGRVLGGRYRLTERLGQGGMGTVYRGMHTLMDKPVAVKILRGELSTDAEAVARFHREARSASRLDHDHCIRVTDFGQSDDGLLYLAMELLSGRSLAERMRQERLPIDQAVRIAHSVALALEHAHEAGVIHRDLKPDNVFLAQRARGREVVKVLDFGLAKLASDSGKSRSITRDGTVFGTPEYMAPEQAQGDPLDARTDLYALGVVLYNLLTGELPFKAETFVALLTKHVREKPRPPRELEPSIPPELETVVLTCLQKKAADRYPSATALAEALLPFAARVDATGSSSITVPRPQIAEPDATDTSLDEEPVRRARWPIFAALALVAATLGVLSRLESHPTTVVAPPIVATGPERELVEVAALAKAGKLEEAASRLEVLHRNGETPALERMTSEVAEKRGHRLDALAHMHRAKTLAPEDASLRVALAALLLRFGHASDACQQATRAIELAKSDDATSAAARGILKEASCAAHDSRPAASLK